MNKQEYIDEAWRRIGRRMSRNEADVGAVDRALARCYEDGFSLKDAVRYCRLTEHINPDLSERYACDQMFKIASKYHLAKPTPKPE